jgi:hypothetical protein
LRAHLRECDDCAGFARSQRAQRGALKALGAIPLPQSLVGLFGGGGAATVGGGVAVKAAAIAAGAALATGVGYEGVKHGIAHPTRPSATGSVVEKQPTRSRPAAAATVVVVARSQEARHDQKPFRKSAVKARRAAVKRHGKPAGRPASARPAQAQAVAASSSHAHVQKPKRVKPAHPTHGTTPAATRSHGQNAGGQGKRSNPPKKKETPPPAKGKGKGGGGGAGDGTTGAPGKGGGGNGNNASR